MKPPSSQAICSMPRGRMLDIHLAFPNTSYRTIDEEFSCFSCRLALEGSSGWYLFERQSCPEALS